MAPSWKRQEPSCEALFARRLVQSTAATGHDPTPLPHAPIPRSGFVLRPNPAGCSHSVLNLRMPASGGGGGGGAGAEALPGIGEPPLSTQSGHRIGNLVRSRRLCPQCCPRPVGEKARAVGRGSLDRPHQFFSAKGGHPRRLVVQTRQRRPASRWSVVRSYVGIDGRRTVDHAALAPAGFLRSLCGG